MRAPPTSLVLLVLLALHTSAKVAIDDDFILFRVHTPEDIGYIFRALTAEDFGGVFEEVYQRKPLVPSDPLSGCSPFENALDIRGGFALVRRGECSFAEKSEHAQAAGAKAVFIYDHQAENDA